MRYFKSQISGLSARLYVRGATLADVKAVLALFKLLHPTNMSPLTTVNRFMGWWMFRGIPEDHAVMWEEAGAGTELVWHSASREDLSSQREEYSRNFERVELGSMRNRHPLLGSERYRMSPYPGWELAKEYCTPDEVVPIFNAYLRRAFGNRNTVPQLVGDTWAAVEASAKDPKDSIYGCQSFPDLPDFYRLLALRMQKVIVVGNHCISDCAGVFHSRTEIRYYPNGGVEVIDQSPSYEEASF